MSPSLLERTSDTITASKNVNFTLADTGLSSSDGMNLVLSAVGAANLTGGAGNLLFAIGSWSGTGSLTGGGGSDTVTMTKDTNFTLSDTALTGPGGQGFETLFVDRLGQNGRGRGAVAGGV